MKLYRVILPVADIEKASDFYSKVLGQDGVRVSPGRHYFDLSGVILACYDPKADGDSTGDGWKFHENQYLYFSVDDLPEIHQRISALKSVPVGRIEQMPWGEELFYAEDVFGNPICFVNSKTVFTGL